MVTILEENNRIPEYSKYLRNHISNVNRSWLEILRPVVEKKDVDNVYKCDDAIKDHDKSKYSSDEFYPYLNHFYPSTGENVKDNDDQDLEFDLAWLSHIHNNPHHWQHYVLVRDSGDIVPLDMPFEYIMEMLCDWHSFSARDPESTACKWYYDNKDKMKLSDKTIETIEKYIDCFDNNPLR